MWVRSINSLDLRLIHVINLPHTHCVLHVVLHVLDYIDMYSH